MLPSTTVGTGLSSLVPWPKESSVPPEGLSALRTSVTDAQSIEGAGSSTLRLASVSISKLLPGRLTSGWLAPAGVGDSADAAIRATATGTTLRPLPCRALRAAEIISGLSLCCSEQPESARQPKLHRMLENS